MKHTLGIDLAASLLFGVIAVVLRKLFKTRRATYQGPGQAHSEELTNVGLLAQALTYPIGHNRSVGIAFQFLLVGSPAIELNGRYSASKLMPALARPGQKQPVANWPISSRSECHRDCGQDQAGGELTRTLANSGCPI